VLRSRAKGSATLYSDGSHCQKVREVPDFALQLIQEHRTVGACLGIERARDELLQSGQRRSQPAQLRRARLLIRHDENTGDLVVADADRVVGVQTPVLIEEGIAELALELGIGVRRRGERYRRGAKSAAGAENRDAADEGCGTGL